MAHKTMIDSTGYDIKSGRVLIDGTGYAIKKGRTLIDGTGYDIGFSTPLGELEEGTLVKLNEDGTPVEFYVAKHDYESGLNGAGKTLLVRKDCWNNSSPDQVLYTVADYVEHLDADVQSLIPEINIYVITTYSSWKVESRQYSGSFSLSATELGFSSSYVDGTELPIASILNIAYKNGAPSAQWTRSAPYNQYGFFNYYLNAQGQLKSASSTVESQPTRPAFTLPAKTMFDSDFNIIIP